MRKTRTWAGKAAMAGLLAAPAGAGAQVVTWDLACSTAGQIVGGAAVAFPTCLSAQLTLDGAAATLRLWNRSGEAGTYAKTVFTAVGIGGIGDASVTTVSAARANGAALAGWKVVRGGGGIQGPSDAAGFAVSGIKSGIASDAFADFKGARTAWDDATGFGAGFVTFRVGFSAPIADPSAMSLELHAQGGPNGASTGFRCLGSVDGAAGAVGGSDDCAYTDAQRLGGATSVVPEPATWLMLSSGLVAIGVVVVRRREG